MSSMPSKTPGSVSAQITTISFSKSGPTDVFFFQAEDGIRDGRVTGVQTRALPICSLHTGFGYEVRVIEFDDRAVVWEAPGYQIGRASCGKECRSRWSPYH